MVNLGKEIENEERWNEKKLGPCMNVFLNFEAYTPLDLFHPKQWLQKRSNIKEIETWKVANRLWNGKMIKNDQCGKRTPFYGLRTKRMQIMSYGNFQLTKLQLSYICSEQKGKQLEKRINTREKQSFSESWYNDLRKTPIPVDT